MKGQLVHIEHRTVEAELFRSGCWMIMACMLHPRYFNPFSILSNFPLVDLAMGAELLTSGELVFGTLIGDWSDDVAIP